MHIYLCTLYSTTHGHTPRYPLAFSPIHSTTAMIFSPQYDLYQSNFPCIRQPPILPASQPACQSVGSC